MREPIVSNSYYHVYNRGVDKRVIFLDEHDYHRFYESMYLFNDLNYKHRGGTEIEREALLAGHEVYSYGREPLVSIVSFCLRPTHFHLLLKQTVPEGISKFLHRVGMGYANYFNIRYDRKGRLCEGPFKAKPVDSEEHLQLLPRYIHLNALDGSPFEWRDGGHTNWDGGAERKLNEYRWSSHPVYLKNKQRLPVVDEEIVRKWFATKEAYLQYLKVPTFFGAEEPSFVWF